MKCLALSALIFSFIALAQDIPDATLNRLKKLYPDQSEAFLKERLKNAPLAFNKWRSFPPYYYEMLDRNPEIKKLAGRSGLCAGDAHIENFGFIHGTPPQFTINDLDDVTPCDLNRDLMRLFIGHRLIKPDLKADTFLNHYQNGFKGLNCPVPSFIQKLAGDSEKKGRSLSKKNKALLDSKSCTGEYAPLSLEEQNMLEAFNNAENGDKACLLSPVLSEDLKKLALQISQSDPKQIIHACSRVKESGGSAGGKRFVIFRKSTTGVVDAFELKPLLRPAPNYNTAPKPEVRARIYEAAVKTYLGVDQAEHYYPVTLNKVLYQRRPLWGGNEEVKEDDLNKAGPSEKEAVMLFETCRLGALHARTKPGVLSVSAPEWERLATNLEKQFKSEFGQN
jgi:hypothetical protein